MVSLAPLFPFRLGLGRFTLLLPVLTSLQPVSQMTRENLSALLHATASRSRLDGASSCNCNGDTVLQFLAAQT